MLLMPRYVSLSSPWPSAPPLGTTTWNLGTAALHLHYGHHAWLWWDGAPLPPLHSVPCNNLWAVMLTTPNTHTLPNNE